MKTIDKPSTTVIISFGSHIACLLWDPIVSLLYHHHHHHHDDDPQGSSGQMWTCRCSCYSNCVLPQGEPGRLYQMFMTINVIIIILIILNIIIIIIIINKGKLGSNVRHLS